MRESNLDQLHRELEREQRKLVPESTWETQMQAVAEKKIAEPGTNIDKVYQVLAEAEQQMTSKEIAEITGLSISQVSSAISKITLRTTVNKVMHGNTMMYRLGGDKPPKRDTLPVVRYQVTPEPAPASPQCDVIALQVSNIRIALEYLEMLVAKEDLSHLAAPVVKVKAMLEPLNPQVANDLDPVIEYLTGGRYVA